MQLPAQARLRLVLALPQMALALSRVAVGPSLVKPPAEARLRLVLALPQMALALSRVAVGPSLVKPTLP